MKHKRLKKLCSFLLISTMLLGIIPNNLPAYAEDEIPHTHTESCYAQAGDLLCSLPESEGHSHNGSCYCLGGEFICGKDEGEEHTHNAECICAGGELICETDESAGHSHGEGCYALGGELICDLEKPILTALTPSLLDASATVSEYDFIKDLFAADSSITFDTATQTLAVIDTEHLHNDHLQSFGITDADDLIKNVNIEYNVKINGAVLPKETKYYIVSKDTHTVETKKIVGGWGSYISKPELSADENKIAVFIINKGDNYHISLTFNDDNFYNEAHMLNRYNGNGFSYHLKDDETYKEYSGTAGDSIIETMFSYEWDICNYLDIEIWIADAEKQTYANPGLIDLDADDAADKYDGYVDFKIELRDKDGNISLLPKTFVCSFGSDNFIYYMEQDGIVHIPIATLTYDPITDDPYGEFDIYIPFGYDYRISLFDYSIDPFGGYSYVMNQEHEYDDEGFCITDKSIAYADEWGSWLTYNFMPLNKEVKVEKKVVGSSTTEDYTFKATQNVYTYARNNSEYKYKSSKDLTQILCNYPYDIYNATTGEKINTSVLKTDVNGKFTLKDNQYAIFKVWEAPDNIRTYDEWGVNIVADVFAIHDDVETQSKYIFEELESTDCETIVTLTRDAVENTITEKKVKDVVGNDKILFTNIYPVINGIGDLKVSVTESANDTSKEFTFTVTLDDTSINGAYGDMEFVNGVATFTLKHGESKTATMLPEGAAYTVTESDNSGYTVTVNSTEGMTASGTIVANTTTNVSFVNTKISTGGSTPGGSTPGGSTPSDKTPSDKTPSHKTPSDKTPSDKTPSDKTPSDSTPDNDDIGTNIDEDLNLSDTTVAPIISENVSVEEQPPVSEETDLPSATLAPEKELDDIPQTGDTMNLTLCIFMLGISIIGMIISLRQRRFYCRKYRN